MTRLSNRSRLRRRGSLEGQPELPQHRQIVEDLYGRGLVLRHRWSFTVVRYLDGPQKGQEWRVRPDLLQPVGEVVW